MPDYPYVYGEGPVRPIGPGGTTRRVFRKRATAQGGAPVEERYEEGQDLAWRRLLEEAVEELNASFSRSQAPFACFLEEDGAGFALRVRRLDVEGGASDEEGETIEDFLDPAELPQWLARLRAHLGILVDEKA